MTDSKIDERQLSNNLQHKSRDTGIEVLRIFAMFLIVAHHFSVHGNFSIDSVNANNLIIGVFSLFGKVGVNIFIIVSGYYAEKSKITLTKFLRLLSEVTFYSVILYFVSVKLNNESITAEKLFIAFFPLFFEEYWFFCEYFVLMIFAPLINEGIKHITNKQHLLILVLLFVMWIAVPRILEPFIEVKSPGYSNLGYFVFLYLLGAYVRKKHIWVFDNRRFSVLMFVGCFLIFIISKLCADILIQYGDNLWIGLRIIRFGTNILSNAQMNAFMPLATSFFSFLVFKDINFKPNKLLYTVASATFGVYLIHDNSFIRRFLWNDIIQTTKHINIFPPVFLLYAILSVILVFVVCTVIEIFRKKIIEKPFVNLIDKFISKKRKQ